MLQDCSSQIENSVQQFWNDLNVDKSKLCLTIDEYLSIFMYIIVHSRIRDLEAHLFIINSFLNDFTLFSSKAG